MRIKDACGQLFLFFLKLRFYKLRLFIKRLFRIFGLIFEWVLNVDLGGRWIRQVWIWVYCFFRKFHKKTKQESLFIFENKLFKNKQT
ncbi:MAG TPA: hypothetical protein DCK78_20180 [Paenibacillus lactis]|nr:hypothetical protein [Paenibacillus lactis]